MTGKIISIILSLGALPCLAQSNLLQISSPARGTIVNPGQLVIISVNADPSVSNVTIVGQGPLGLSQTTNGQPLQFQLTIPSNTTIGSYNVSALGSASDGSLVISPAISLQVDTPNTQFVISTVPSVLRFSAPGQKIPLHVIGRFPDGSQLDVTHSVQMDFSTANPQVATIDGQGMVTAVGLGSTYIGVSSNIAGQLSLYNVSTTVGQLATMVSPGIGTTLSSSSVSFYWNGVSGATAYRLEVGSTQGGNDYYESGTLPPTTLAAGVTGLPVNNQEEKPLYVTLWTESNGQWANNQYQYTLFYFPDFTISASPSSLTVRQGQLGTSTITTNGTLGLCYAHTISLSASGLPLGTTASFNPGTLPGGGAQSSTLTLTVGSGTPVGNYPITVTGYGCSVRHTTTVTLTVWGTATFSVSASPSSLNIVQGNQGTSTITTTALYGFSGAIALTVSNLPSGATGSFSPSTIPSPGTGTSTLTINVGTGTSAGTYNLTVKGTSGSLSQTTTISLTVLAKDFSISATPTSQSVQRGSAASYTVTLTPLNGFVGTVTLSTTGCPTHATCSFSPASVAPPGNSTFIVSTTSQTQAKTYTVTPKGTSGSLSHSTDVSLTVTQ